LCISTEIDAVARWHDQIYEKEFAGMKFLVNGGRIPEIVAAIDADVKHIGIPCMFTHHWPIVRELAQAIRDKFPAVTIILGGEHVSGIPEYCLNDSVADCIVVGEGEDTIRELVKCLDSGSDLAEVSGIVYRDRSTITPRNNKRRSRIRDVDTIALPAWHYFPVATYMDRKMFGGPSRGRTMPILATRGCPYQCTFCTSPSMWTTRWDARAPKDVVDEMESYMQKYGATDFQFVDLTAVVKRSWILEFCAEIQSRHWKGITWQLPSGTRSEAIDFEVAENLKKAGCYILTYAPESGSPALLKRVKKRISIDKLFGSIRDVRRAGLRVECFTIMGFSDERMSEMLATVWFVMRLALHGVESVAITTWRPIPGCEMTNELVEQGKLEYNDKMFCSLVSSTSLLSGVAYNQNYPSYQICLMRVLGYAAFFSTLFITRPMRLVRILKNVATQNQTSKLEKALIEIARAKILYLRTRFF
jgi:anaerobic magnesium-protoporphyrin IX monomethyl ester cyclase